MVLENEYYTISEMAEEFGEIEITEEELEQIEIENKNLCQNGLITLFNC